MIFMVCTVSFFTHAMIDSSSWQCQCDKLVKFPEKRSVALVEYMTEITQEKTCEQLLKEIKHKTQHPYMTSVLVNAFYQCIVEDLKYVGQFERVDQIDARYEKKMKIFLCQCLFSSKTDSQIEEKIRLAPTDLKKSVMFGIAKHCGRIVQNQAYASYMQQNNIQRKD